MVYINQDCPSSRQVLGEGKEVIGALERLTFCFKVRQVGTHTSLSHFTYDSSDAKDVLFFDCTRHPKTTPHSTNNLHIMHSP